jgi:hypothetical protein
VNVLRRNIITAALHGAALYQFDLIVAGWFGRPDSTDSALHTAGSTDSALNTAGSTDSALITANSMGVGSTQTATHAADHANTYTNANPNPSEVSSNNSIVTNSSSSARVAGSNATKTAAIWGAISSARNIVASIFAAPGGDLQPEIAVFTDDVSLGYMRANGMGYVDDTIHPAQWLNDMEVRFEHNCTSVCWMWVLNKDAVTCPIPMPIED